MDSYNFAWKIFIIVMVIAFIFLAGSIAFVILDDGHILPEDPPPQTIILIPKS